MMSHLIVLTVSHMPWVFLSPAACSDHAQEVRQRGWSERRVGVVVTERSDQTTGPHHQRRTSGASVRLIIKIA